MLLFALALLGISPWGNFPLNDDWHYAHLAKTLSETGSLIVDVPVMASAVVQAYMGALAIKIFGFSFDVLRLLTFLVSIGLIFVFESILRWVRLVPVFRALLLSVLILNPLYLHFSTTFMTELYGFFLAFAGAGIWFRRRSERGVEKTFCDPVLMLSAFLVGTSFWVRQFSVLVFPALWVATFEIETSSFKGRLARVFRGWRLWGSFVLPVIAYFIWARETGNFKPEFGNPLSRMLSFNAGQWILQPWIFVVYASVFFAPVLYLIWSRDSVLGLGKKGLAWWISGVLVLSYIFVRGDRGDGPLASLHSVFPFLGNVLTPYGVGPITFTDVYIQNALVRPTYPGYVWWVVEALAFALSFAWLGVWYRGCCLAGRARQLFFFGAALAALSVFVVVQSFGTSIFDRYHMGAFLGLLFCLAAMLSTFRVGDFSRARWIGVWILLVPLSTFSVSGVHDYFRWNAVRWQAYRELLVDGVQLEAIDGGYEINGWNFFERKDILHLDKCDGKVSWFCGDRPYGMGLNLMPDTELIRSYPVETYLGNFPNILVFKKKSVSDSRARPNSR